MTKYTTALKDVFNHSKVQGMNRSLSTITKLCEIYNHPQNEFLSIHVAGTNGKGSVCTKIATALQHGGYRCGLYTSPHISSFRERIKINGELIDELEIAGLLKDIEKTVIEHQLPATFFEIATLLSFLYFRNHSVDIAVIETGLGGTWDATNVIRPLLSIISSISYDHTETLGATLEMISKEKAGIIKTGVPVVIGPHVSRAHIESMSTERGCVLFQSSPFPDYDLENQGIARMALDCLADYFPLLEPFVEAGLQVRPPCRFEQQMREKPVILDVAHNPDGFLRLIKKLKTTYPDYHYRFVVGFSTGKDILSCAKEIQKHASAIHLVSGEHPRLATIDEIAPFFSSYIREASISAGIKHALDEPSSHPEVVVIAGSFFIMLEARKALGIDDFVDPQIWYDPLRTMRS